MPTISITRWVVLTCVLPLLGQAAEHFAAASASPGGDGSREHPWPLAAALANAKQVQPGDTLWILPGVYKGGFVCELRGTEAASITLRGVQGAPGERATLDLTPRDAKDAAEFNLKGDWLVIRDLEIMSSDPKRSTEQKGSWPTDIRRGTISARGSHLKFINLVVHDLSQGIGMWGNEDSGFGGEIYGCLIYHNGWNAPDRGHGHGIYAQNARGTKRIEDNIIFNQFGYGLHAYGSEKAYLRGFHIERNVLFNNGSLKAPGHRSSDLAVGGSCPLQDVTITWNYTYGGGGLRIGYAADVLNRLTLVNNYLVGPARFTAVAGMTCSGNRFIAPGTLLTWESPKKKSPYENVWKSNEYTRTRNEFAAFNLTAHDKTQGLDYEAWQRFIADSTSAYEETPMAGRRVLVHKNRYEPSRAHVIVYNWDKDPSVEVDLAPVLTTGQRYRIMSAQDIFGQPVLTGVHDGTPLELPMHPHPPSPPIGLPNHPLPITEPEFGVFIVFADS